MWTKFDVLKTVIGSRSNWDQHLTHPLLASRFFVAKLFLTSYKRHCDRSHPRAIGLSHVWKRFFNSNQLNELKFDNPRAVIRRHPGVFGIKFGFVVAAITKYGNQFSNPKSGPWTFENCNEIKTNFYVQYYSRITFGAFDLFLDASSPFESVKVRMKLTLGRCTFWCQFI